MITAYRYVNSTSMSDRMKKNYKDTNLKDKLVCFTGSLMLGTRKEAIGLVNSCGGEGTERFTRYVSILVCGYGPGRAKLEAARTWGTLVMSEQEFMDYVLKGSKYSGSKIPVEVTVTPENDNIRSFNFDD